MDILAYRYKLEEVGYRIYNRIYTHVRTNEGLRKIYESTKGNFILINGKRQYINIP